MHIQLTDFGSSVIVEDTPTTPSKEENPTNDAETKPLQRKNSFVGTAQFVAPEILQRGPIHYGFVGNFYPSRHQIRVCLDLISGH